MWGSSSTARSYRFLRRARIDGLELQPFLKPVSGLLRGVSDRLAPLHHPQLALSDAHVELEYVLTIVDLPVRLAIAHDHAVADRADAEARQRRGLRQVLAQVLEGPADASGRHLGLRERASVRSTIRSWNEKRYCRRGPRVGLTNPPLISPWIVPRDSRRTRSTSRTL